MGSSGSDTATRSMKETCPYRSVAGSICTRSPCSLLNDNSTRLLPRHEYLFRSVCCEGMSYAAFRFQRSRTYHVLEDLSYNYFILIDAALYRAYRQIFWKPVLLLYILLPCLCYGEYSTGSFLRPCR